jgi:hypothetical protein
VGFGVLAGLVLMAHVLVVTVGVAEAAPLLGGVAVALLLAGLVAAHVIGLRRLANRRRHMR